MLLRSANRASDVSALVLPVDLRLLLSRLLPCQACQPPAQVALSIVPVKPRQLLVSLHSTNTTIAVGGITLLYMIMMHN